jgi:hypothetical protein
VFNPQVGFTPNSGHGLAPRKLTLCASGSFASIVRVNQTVVVSDVTRRSEYPDPKLEAI